jgi:prepilin-type N-terminal cleavage/methylation domain-containing protein
MKNNFKINAGYTIIETMIAVSIFLIVVMIGMGSLLNANLIYQKSGNIRSIMDSLSFVMEDMSRNLRTGSHYYCMTSDSVPALGTTSSGQNCLGIAFQVKTQSGDDVEWAYEVVSSGNSVFIRRSENGGSTWTTLTPEEVVISGNIADVSGADVADNLQPFATLRLVGTISYQDVTTPFSLQTSVSQRKKDI